MNCQAPEEHFITIALRRVSRMGPPILGSGSVSEIVRPRHATRGESIALRTLICLLRA